MPLQQYPVVVPYRLHERADAPQYTLHADVVASAAGPAAAVAKVLCRAASLLHHGQAPVEIVVERCRIGAPAFAVRGPYCYVFTRGDRLPAISLPRRIEAGAGKELAETLAGLDPELIHGAVLDAAQLGGIDSTGLAALVEHSGRIGLHLCRVPAAIAKVLAIAQLSPPLHIHPDLRSALEAMIRAARMQRSRLDERGFVARE